MRELTSHNVDGGNHQLQVHVLDEPTHGNACHQYSISNVQLADTDDWALVINFQNGPISENGINGVSNEALLAIVEDRLKCFQTSQYACRENALALTKVQEALHWLHHRTKERMARNVEGTHQV